MDCTNISDWFVRDLDIRLNNLTILIFFFLFLLILGEYYRENGSATGAQERMIALQNITNERYYRCIQQAVQSGVKVALGSDFVGWDPKITG